MIASLLQVVTSLLQVDCQDFLSTSLMQVVSTTRSKSADFDTDLTQLDEANRLDAIAIHPDTIVIPITTIIIPTTTIIIPSATIIIPSTTIIIPSTTIIIPTTPLGTRTSPSWCLLTRWNTVTFKCVGPYRQQWHRCCQVHAFYTTMVLRFIWQWACYSFRCHGYTRRFKGDTIYFPYLLKDGQ